MGIRKWRWNTYGGVKDETYDFVYSSHTLEHINDIYTALKNWIRILKKDFLYCIYLMRSL